MIKRKRTMLLCIALILLLSGCACKHQWTEPDCLNPQICTKCEAVGQAALGHEWMPASCTAPQTCSRCSQTQGQPLEHLFGSWSVQEETMTHSCSLCGLEETRALDQEVYLDLLLQGYWEITAVVDMHQQAFYSADVFDSIVGEYLQFTQGQTVTGMLNREEFSGTWKFHQLDKRDNGEIYIFQALGETGRELEMHLIRAEKQDTLMVFFADGLRMILACYDDLVSEIAGTWRVDAGQTDSYHLSFREDRRVSCSLNQEFEGSWHLTPMQQTGSLAYYGLYIIPDAKENPEILAGNVIFPGIQATAPYCISLKWNADGIDNKTTDFMFHTKD